MEKILEALQNVSYIGVLKQRWEEIKKLTVASPNRVLSCA